MITTKDITEGYYSTVYGRDADKHDLTAPVEGMCEGWQGGLSYTLSRYKTKEERQAFMEALYILRNSFKPESYPRSVPIMRFQRQLHVTIDKIERARLVDRG